MTSWGCGLLLHMCLTSRNSQQPGKKTPHSEAEAAQGSQTLGLIFQFGALGWSPTIHPWDATASGFHRGKSPRPPTKAALHPASSKSSTSAYQALVLSVPSRCYKMICHPNLGVLHSSQAAARARNWSGGGGERSGIMQRKNSNSATWKCEEESEHAVLLCQLSGVWSTIFSVVPPLMIKFA